MFKLKNLKKYLFGDGEGETNLNRFMKKKQNVVGAVVLVVLALSALGLHSLSKKKEKKPRKVIVSQTASVDGVLSTDFTQKNELSALEQQQAQMDELKTQLKNLNKQKTEEQKHAGDRKAEMIKQINTIISSREKGLVSHKDQTGGKVIENKVPATPTPQQQVPHVITPSFRPHQMEMISFNYKSKEPKRGGYYEPSGPKRDGENEPRKTPKNYVPAGTFAKTVLLEGADANASVNAQSDTSGILVRVLDSGTLPNGHHSHLKGCFILASIYGDISSERGEARLTKISCTRADGSILEKKVQGYLSFAGKEGIKGTPVMRNGKVLMMAGISGMLSGVGSALQQASQVQSISPLGVTNTVSANKVWQNGAYGGANTAMSQMAGYYIKRADQYHPIIEIGSGTIATVIFQNGFSLLDNVKYRKSHTNEYPQSNNSVESAQEVRRLLKQAQQVSSNSASQSGQTDSPFSNITHA